MNTSLDIKKIYELIDLYKYASVSGERVEVIITPYEENGKWDNSKRVLTIGLQGGFSRDRDSIVIQNAEEFDEKVLPLLVSYFEQDDTLGKWEIVTPEVENVTNKGVSETESGNILYLESFDKDIYDRVTEAKENVKANTTYKRVKLDDKEKVWDEIILYAKRRRTTQDFYNGQTYTDEEKKAVYDFVVNLSNEKRVNTTFIRKSLENTQKFIEEVFKDRDKLKTLGLTDELIDKLNNSIEFSKLAKLVSAEKRIRRRVDVNNPFIAPMIEFATTELEKVDYFDLRNASLDQFDNQTFKSSKPLAIQKLKQTYEKNSLYENYCDEILSYLNKKAMANNRVVETTIEEPKIVVNNELNNNYIVDSYEKFYETVDLVRYGKLDDERYEIIVEKDKLDSNARIVRISLLDGVSRNDSFMFKFNDGALFDLEFKKLMENIREEDPNFISTINAVNVPTLGLVKHALHESRDRNEILIKYASDDLAYPHSTKVVEETKKDDKNNALDEDMLEKLTQLEKQINAEAQKQEQEMVVDTTVSFDKLHEYVNTYKIDNSKGELKIYRRDTGEEFIPVTEAEKSNIEFATYWGVAAGIEENKDDVVVGEKYAFNEENKKLFDLLDVQFRESVKRGIPVDIESLKTQFENSGVKGNEAIYERLFRNVYYVDYVTKYYQKSLGKEVVQDNTKTVTEPLVEQPLENDFIQDDVEVVIKPLNEKPLYDEEKIKQLISKLTKLFCSDDLPLHDRLRQYESLQQECDEVIALDQELQKKSAENPEKYYSLYLDFLGLYVDMMAVKSELSLKLESLKEQEKNKLSFEDKELSEYFKLDILRRKGKLRADGYRRIDELKNSNEKVLGLEIALDNVREADSKLSSIEDKESDLYKLLKRELKDKEEALQKLHDIYRRELSEAIKQNEHDELVEGAKDEAHRIIARKEYEQILEDAKKEARRIVEKEEHDMIVEGAKEEAGRIVAKEEHEMIVEGAKEEAAKLLQSGKEDAPTVQQDDEQEKLKKGAQEQAELLMRLKDTLFEIVEQKKEDEKVPEIVEIEDAVDVVETYATADQPTTIKLFFDRNTPDVADLIISNGSKDNETVMYQRTFDKDKIVKDIIPVVCDLYAQNNTPYYNQIFDVPNTNRGGLIVIGTNEKTFQISNAEKDIVALCEKLIDEKLANNKKEEEQKTK